MFGKVKSWLGIEGVKVELLLPQEVSIDSGEVNGKIRLSSMNPHVISAIEVKLVEKYSRGRSKEKLTDEYLLGRIELEQEIEIPANKAIELSFQLPFKMKVSEMDDLESSNILMGGVVKAMKWFENVSSTYRVEAYAKVKGVALDPFDKELILLV